eukprot:TRINITY_DN107596_c0_g1_i1.p1 TRINITY_DN107596_c0_g1~~TRINITY_DN107596_c0_g1_i1.p1  ORF type:complete len:454 (+),score=28.95 TRINITY_DN107596_c0_g1_i1:29-1390(+)
MSVPLLLAVSVLISLLPSPLSNPVPTAPQLAWQQHEIAALVCLNMATFVREGDPACDSHNWNKNQRSGDPKTFWPTNLNISNWVESMHAVGAKHSILTAKHGCGFLLWPTKTTFSNGKPYGYNVGAQGAYPRSVLKEYTQTMQRAGLGHGFYYSTGNNFYLNTVNFKPDLKHLLPGQVNVTQKEYNRLVLEQLQELWTEYGNLTEIWFDHGYGTVFKPEIVKMLKKYQPNAVAFNGYGVSPNPVRWIGTETGMPKYPIWSTGTTPLGSPNSPVWNSPGADTTLQGDDTWFYVPGTPVRSLKTLIDVYHKTVGQNCLLELDFAIDRTGNVHPTHAKQYKALGDWIRECYGKPLASTSGHADALVLHLNTPTLVDRFMIQENQAHGQRIREYKVEYSVDGKAWHSLGSGSSVGNKRIQLVPPTKVVAVQLSIAQASPQAPAFISNFAVFAPCAAG